MTNIPTLYPIGTKCIMRRLSQAALCAEIFGEKDMQSDFMATPYCDGPIWHDGFESIKQDDYLPVKWRITVTEENQRWLSPVPMVGDLVSRDHLSNDIVLSLSHVTWQRHFMYDPEADLVQKRTYPNGQRAPLIEFDEVIEP